MEYLSVHEISKLWKMKERRITSLCRDNRIPGVKKVGTTWLIPSNALIPLDKRTKDYETKLEEDKQITPYSNISTSEKVIKYFKNKYKRDPLYTSFTPYRICPIGAHIDHNLGKITGFALDKGIHIAYNIKNNGIIELESLQFPKRAQWHVLETPPEKEQDWADHLRGATIALNKRYPLRYGMSAVIDGELPIGGLSSSGTMIIAFVNALATLNNIKLTKETLIDIANEAESKYVGMLNGKLDQSSELYAKKNHLLYMDMKDNSYELIETPKSMKNFVIGVFFSGINKNLTSDIYNTRVDELRSAAYILKAYSGIEYGEFAKTNMRDIPYDIFLKYNNKLPKKFTKRAIHWYEEVKRVEKGIDAYKKGDIEEFGRLMTESGQSSIDNWDVGSKQLIKLYEILKETPGVYGTRFAGSGFKGCCIALIDPKYEKSIMKIVKDKYLSLYPNLTNKYSAHICHTADGIKL